MVCPKITLGNTLNFTSKSQYMLLPNFLFQLECLNFKLYLSTFFLMFAYSPTLSLTSIYDLSCYELLHFHLPKLTLLELILSIFSPLSTMIENNFFNLHPFHSLNL